MFTQDSLYRPHFRARNWWQKAGFCLIQMMCNAGCIDQFNMCYRPHMLRRICLDDQIVTLVRVVFIERLLCKCLVPSVWTLALLVHSSKIPLRSSQGRDLLTAIIFIRTIGTIKSAITSALYVDTFTIIATKLGDLAEALGSCIACTHINNK